VGDGVFQHWWQWVSSAGADFDECSMQSLVHCWRTVIAIGGVCVQKSVL